MTEIKDKIIFCKSAFVLKNLRINLYYYYIIILLLYYVDFFLSLKFATSYSLACRGINYKVNKLTGKEPEISSVRHLCDGHEKFLFGKMVWQQKESCVKSTCQVHAQCKIQLLKMWQKLLRCIKLNHIKVHLLMHRKGN